VSAADIATANNTISIIMSGPLAKNIADEYDVDPRKSASLLDIFAGCFQALNGDILATPAAAITCGL
jgi:Na+/H+ antiporter NhaC